MNWAYGQPTWQSSNYLGYNSSLAVDGNRDPIFNHGSCMHTSDTGDPTPWWAVDLGQLIIVQEVYLTNRGDCCGRFEFRSICVSNQCSGEYLYCT